MRNPLFEGMGKDYPVHLEAEFGRILRKIEELWETPQIHDYFSDLLIDKRGGRKGFPEAVLKDLIKLREYRELQTFRAAERRGEALEQLEAMGLACTTHNFLKAFNSGNKELVDLYVRANVKLPPDDGKGISLLLSALKKGHTIVAKIVLDAGAEVNIKDNLGLTPLLVACGKPTAGYRAIAEALIAKGALLDVRDPLGNTPLLLALTGGMYDIALSLIKHGANINAATRTGVTPLDMVRDCDDPRAAAIVDLLLGRDAAT